MLVVAGAPAASAAAPRCTGVGFRVLVYPDGSYDSAQASIFPAHSPDVPIWTSRLNPVHPRVDRASKEPWRHPAARKGPEMTSRLRPLWIALVAATATAAVFTTPVVVAGITCRALD